jgi:hypothetical protein
VSPVNEENNPLRNTYSYSSGVDRSSSVGAESVYGFTKDGAARGGFAGPINILQGQKRVSAIQGLGLGDEVEVRDEWLEQLNVALGRHLFDTMKE